MINFFRHRPPPPPSNRERGSIIVPAAFAIIVGIALLGSAQLAYVFYMKRELQSAADLAALSSVQVLNATQPARCTEAKAAAITSGIANMTTMAGALDTDDFKTLDCRRWDPAHWQNPTQVDPTKLYIYVADPALGEDSNAMHVKISKSIPAIMPNPFGAGSPTVIEAEAVATTNLPTATFSVGSQLLRTNGNAPLMNLLGLLGLSVSASAGDYNGLAALKITPSGLLKELGISPEVAVNAGTPSGLVSAKVVLLRQLLEASASIASKSGNTSAEQEIGTLINVLSGAPTQVLDVSVPLFGGTSPEGLPITGIFGSVTSNMGDAALNAQFDVLGLASTAIATASNNHALAVQNLTIGGSGSGISVMAAVVEAPSIGVGGVGTIAYNSQVRLFINIDTKPATGAPPSIFGTIGSVLTLLGIRVHIPIVINLIDGLGTLTTLDCSAPTRRAVISVQSTLMRACVGQLDSTSAFSVDGGCDPRLGLQSETLLTLLNKPVITARIDVPGLKATSDLTFNVDAQHPTPQLQSTAPNPLAVGDTVKQLINQVLNVLGNLGDPSNAALVPGNSAGAVPVDGDIASVLAKKYLSSSPLTPLFNRYDVAKTIALMKNGSAALGLQSLGDWTIKGVPYPCNFGDTCFKDGSVYDAFNGSATGAGQGIKGGLFGTLTGGLLVNNCYGLISGLFNYNSCLESNLAAYLRTAPGGIANTPGSTLTPQSCGVLCTLLKPAVNLIGSLLNGVGSLASKLAGNVLGIQVGQTDVTLMNLSCAKPRLVY
jgi:uncharacterized membrane protein